MIETQVDPAARRGAQFGHLAREFELAAGEYRLARDIRRRRIALGGDGGADRAEAGGCRHAGESQGGSGILGFEDETDVDRRPGGEADHALEFGPSAGERRLGVDRHPPSVAP